jgi:hypothetical protein
MVRFRPAQTWGDGRLGRLRIEVDVRALQKQRLLDGRSDTAWIEGRSGVGKGEWIEIVFKPGAQIRGIGILIFSASYSELRSSWGPR